MAVDELRIAFKLGCQGDLNQWLPKDKDGIASMNHYQNFNAEYLGRVLKAYSELRQKELAKAQSKLPTSFIEPEIDSERYLIDKLYTPYEMLKKGKYLFTDLDERLLYNKLDRMGLVMATTEQKKEAMIIAKERLPLGYRQSKDDYLKKVKEKAKEICFRNWIENCALEGIDIKEQLNKL